MADKPKAANVNFGTVDIHIMPQYPQLSKSNNLRKSPKSCSICLPIIVQWNLNICKQIILLFIVRIHSEEKNNWKIKTFTGLMTVTTVSLLLHMELMIWLQIFAY